MAEIDHDNYEKDMKIIDINFNNDEEIDYTQSIDIGSQL